MKWDRTEVDNNKEREGSANLEKCENWILRRVNAVLDFGYKLIFVGSWTRGAFRREWAPLMRPTRTTATTYTAGASSWLPAWSEAWWSRWGFRPYWLHHHPLTMALTSVSELASLEGRRRSPYGSIWMAALTWCTTVIATPFVRLVH